MQMCAAHWERLLVAIEERGLSALVSEGGEAAAKNLVSELNDGLTVDNFDPLMGAHNAILNNCLDVAKACAGASGVMEMLAGECPLCLLIMRHAEACQDTDCALDYGTWCERAADDMVTAWKSFKT